MIATFRSRWAAQYKAAPRCAAAVAACFALQLLPRASGAGSFMDMLEDPRDGQLDTSEWLLDERGFLPVPIIITEPAFGGDTLWQQLGYKSHSFHPIGERPVGGALSP